MTGVPAPDALMAAGWEPVTLDAFSNAVGTLWTRGFGPTREIGFVSRPEHANGHVGSVHGGALMTFSDMFLGIAVVDATGGAVSVTAQMQIQFVSLAKIGVFLVGRAEIVRRTKSLVFVRGLVKDGDTIVASVDGIWKVIAPAEARTNAVPGQAKS